VSMEHYRRQTRRIVFCLVVASVFGLRPQAAQAQIYKYVKDGVVHYTDRPPALTTYETVGSSAANRPSSSRTVSTLQGSSASVSAPKYGDIITRVAGQYGVSADLVKAVIKIESNYNPRAVSPKGARGLMQLMPATALRFGVSDSFDPEDNITGGVKYLRFLLEEFGHQNLDLVLAGYNAGENAVKRFDNQIPPYAETQAYVKKVLALYKPGMSPPYRQTANSNIYRYVNPDGTVTFTNVRRVH
jgi:soluble lytic murein transglycosylase-like protein